MAEQGADGIDDLQIPSSATAMASHLKLPPIKHARLVWALVGDSPSSGGGANNAPVEDKFQVQELIMGNGSVAAGGLNKALGIRSEDLPDLLKKGVRAIVEEFELHGSDEDKANLKYILHGVACKELLPDHVCTQMATGKYHGGSLGQNEFDGGHSGMRLQDFVNHEHCRKANLEPPHVVALRAYTSSSYPCFNSPLRDKIKPHPFKMTVYYLNEAIKLLRTIAAEAADGTFKQEVLIRQASAPPGRSGTRVTAHS
mmetsp:Transcript_25903/g.82015  ORF Transcript_25903/g.82015 Transcript_25903/m.82015 type:complete len:256 (-) Transcript_25903:1248-2015(-)